MLQKQVLSDGPLKLGDTVLYHEKGQGLLPATVVTIFPNKEENGPPDLGLVIFICGMHNPTFQRPRAKHGKEPGEWLMFREAQKLMGDDELSRTEAENAQLAALEELAKLKKAEEQKAHEQKTEEAVSAGSGESAAAE